LRYRQSSSRFSVWWGPSHSQPLHESQKKRKRQLAGAPGYHSPACRRCRAPPSAAPGGRSRPARSTRSRSPARTQWRRASRSRAPPAADPASGSRRPAAPRRGPEADGPIQAESSAAGVSHKIVRKTFVQEGKGKGSSRPSRNAAGAQPLKGMHPEEGLDLACDDLVSRDEGVIPDCSEKGQGVAFACAHAPPFRSGGRLARAPRGPRPRAAARAVRRWRSPRAHGGETPRAEATSSDLCVDRGSRQNVLRAGVIRGE
jgi:hypothetical protein